MQVIDKMIMIQVNIQCWGGRKKLEPGDINYNPEEFIDLGNKRLVPQKRLNGFEKIKKRVERYLCSRGIKFMGGYAIPEDSVDDVTQKLSEFGDEFNAMVNEFVTHFREYVQEQVQSYPEWEDRLERAADEVHPTLGGRFRFGYTAYKLRPPQEEDAEINNQFVSDDDVEAQAIREVSQEAADIVTKVAGKEELKLSSLSPIKRLKGKMQSLTAVNPELFGGAVKLTDLALGEMPTQGAIAGREREIVAHLLFVLHQLANFRVELINGEFNVDMDTFLAEMGCNVQDGQSESNADTGEAEDQAEEAQEEEEEFVWF